MTFVRQEIALGFLCFAYNAFIDQRFLRMLIFVGIAATFHNSAAIFFIIVPFAKGGVSRQRIIFSTLLVVLVAYFLSSYIKHYDSGVAFGAPYRTAMVALSGVVFLWFLDHKWKIQFFQDYKFVMLSSYMMLIPFPLSFFFSVPSDRMAWYLVPIQLSILTRLPFFIRGRYSPLISSAPYAIGALALGVLWMRGASPLWRCVEPYRTWL